MSVPTKNYVSVNSLSSEQKDRLKKVILELNDSMTRVASERDYQREAIKDVVDQMGVDRKIVRRMAKTYFKANFSEETEGDKLFEDFFDQIML